MTDADIKAAIKAIEIHPEQDWWVADMPDIGVATQAKTLPELGVEVERIIVAHFATTATYGIDPFLCKVSSSRDDVERLTASLIQARAESVGTATRARAPTQEKRDHAWIVMWVDTTTLPPQILGAGVYSEDHPSSSHLDARRPVPLHAFQGHDFAEASDEAFAYLRQDTWCGWLGTLDELGNRTVRTSHHRATKGHLPMTTNTSIRPLHDRLLVKRIDADAKTPGGLFIPDNAKEKPVEGLVVAVGDGLRNKDGARIPLDVKAGDRVLFSKYSGSEVKVSIDGGEHLILREDDVLAVLS